MLTSSSFFSGLGGADLGAQMAGLTPVCALEYDRDIAGVYEKNFGPHIRVMDFLELDLSTWPRTDHVHFSPPCPNFSIAKAGAVETAHDIALARKVAEAISFLLPRFVTIENVPAYKKSESFRIIATALDSYGYYWDAQILNAADFGVPQTRKRMMLRAVRGGMLRELPHPTPWRGWFAATEDLHPILPDSEFAPWQLERLAAFFTQLVGGANTSDEQAAPGVGVSRADEPTLAVNTNPAWRAFLMRYQNVNQAGAQQVIFGDLPAQTITGRSPTGSVVHPSEQRDTPILPADSPLFTVLTQENRGSFSPRAFICADQRCNGGKLALTRDSEEPTITVDTRDSGKIRAFIIDQQNGSRDSTIRYESDPVFCQTTYSIKHPSPRAFLAQGGSAGRDIPVSFGEEPATTIKAQEGVRQPLRAWLSNGRVVKMSPRALARFQGFPDSFRLPGKPTERKFRDESGKAWRERMRHAELTDSQQAFLPEYLHSNDKLACKGIGNAVPPQFLAAQIKCLLGE